MKVMQIQAAIKQSGNYSDDPDNYMGWGIPDYELANSIMTTIEKFPADNENLVRVWPNPFTSGNVTIQFSNEISGQVEVQLLNSTGKLLNMQSYKVSNKLNSIDMASNLSSLPAGIYFLKVISGDKIEVKRLIKQ
jgi:serine protease AprX